MPKLDARQRLFRARDLSHAGRPTEALREQVWFHQYALAEIPSLAGIRLSFALSDWIVLANVYPPAMLERLNRVIERNRNTAKRNIFYSNSAQNTDNFINSSIHGLSRPKMPETSR